MSQRIIAAHSVVLVSVKGSSSGFRFAVHWAAFRSPRLSSGSLLDNRCPPKRLAKASASSDMEKQNITESLSSRRSEYVSGAADRVAAARAKDHLAVLEAPHLFGRKRHVVRPSALKVRLGDFRLCGGSSPYRHQPLGGDLELGGDNLHRGRFVRRLNGAEPTGSTRHLIDVSADRLRRIGLLGHGRSIGRELYRFNPVDEAPVCQPSLSRACHR
jgi:hypothetical protein